MRRSQLVQVVVYCPHFSRTVSATRNAVIDRLVDCTEKSSCRDAAPAASEEEPGRSAERPFPCGCPVFPSLAKPA